MRLIIISIFLLFFSFNAISQQVETPDQFLGYRLGDHFTPHYKIVDYFNSMASNYSNKVIVKNYGYSIEGNALLVAIVSSPENISQLEEIRKNNLRLSGLLNDKPSNPNLPTVVWLSFNVHGNEASSSEVSMKLLYELLSGNNDSIKQWLKNTVVIIDPCLNPDGRDRYVHWYNQMIGKTYNANPLAREHYEPWPGGRTNHYNFDLNRDWAWQTQSESVQRMQVYNQWLPQVHCDFHEQYPDNPYYFAPAAEPYHEVISAWQREFQSIMGRNHAKYFDANGWLYFTKEVFDLFYPSYGDTYPLFNGSIGMTYEQAGHSKAGLALKTQDDTLTLSDRILHHYTTSISTIEMASVYSKKINESYQKYFQESIHNGSGLYKTYLIRGENKGKISSIIDLFEKNQIQYQFGISGNKIMGFRYSTGKEENYFVSSNDLVVTTCQPKGNLIKVLFEPTATLVDSLTYDITAWAIPYAYGVDCYAITDKISGQKQISSTTEKKPENNQFAYIAPYQSFKDVQFLAVLLKNGFKIRYAEKDFSFEGKLYLKGSLIILKRDNPQKINQLLQLADRNKIPLSSVTSGYMQSGVDFGSEKVHIIKPPAVALLTGENVSATAAGEIWHLFDQQLDYPLVLMNANDVLSANLNELNVIIIPDGDYKFLSDKECILKSWVKQGGKLIVMENAISQMAQGEWGIKIKKMPDNMDVKMPNYENLKKYQDRERNMIMDNIPGAIYRLLLDNSHPLAFGYPDYFYSLKMNNSVLEFLKDGWNVGVIKENAPLSGFVGDHAKTNIKDGTTIAVQQMGNGSVIYFLDNPIFRSFWENGKLIFTNAVFLVGQ